MARKAPPPRVGDMLAARVESAREEAGEDAVKPAVDQARKASGEDASMLASYHASKLAIGGADGTRQLNTRVPVDLYLELVGVQAALAAELGRKPSVQELVAACLRLGLGDREGLAVMLGGGEAE